MKNYDETMTAYLNDINKIPLLTPEEEYKLCELAAKGNKRAKDKLVTSNLRFVITIAKKFQGLGLDMEDLVSEGNIGLMTAVDHFDVSKNVRFISYAVWWIRQSIQKAISEKGRAIRLPSNRINEIMQIEQAKKVVSKNVSENDQIEEIAMLLNDTPAHVREMMKMGQALFSLESPVSADDEAKTLGNMIADYENMTPEEKAIDTAMKEDIDEALSTLKPTAQKIMKMRYGLYNGTAMSLKAVGDEVGLTKERIRQIEKSSIATLRLPSRRRKLETYVA